MLNSGMAEMWSKIAESLEAIRFRRMVRSDRRLTRRDFRKTADQPRPIYQRARRPSVQTIIAAGDSLFCARSRVASGIAGNAPKIEETLVAIRLRREGSPNRRRAALDRREIQEKSYPIYRRARRHSFRHKSRLRIPYLWPRLSVASGADKNASK